MIQVKHFKTFEGENKRYYVDPMEDREYSRIIAGFTWPGTKDGFFVVLAKDRKTDGGKHMLRTLFEQQCQSIPRLFRTCVVAKPYYLIQQFYGDSTNRPMMMFWANLNVDQVPLSQVYPVEAPHVRDDETKWRTYLETIYAAVSDNKRLQLGKCHTLRAAISELPIDAPEKKPEDFPAVTALAYAVAAMELIER